MSGPKGPGEDDWGFPEVDPASTQLPAPPEEQPTAAFDTGSDAWWRAQASAQRRAAAEEHPPSPLDDGWVPPELPVPAEPLAAPAHPPAVPPVAAPAVEEPVAPAPDWFPGGLAADAVAAEAPMPEEVPPPVEEAPATREPYEGQRVGPARAAAGAALALLGVVLAIVALFVFNGGSEPKGTPTVAAPPASSTRPTAAPSTAAPSAAASTAASAASVRPSTAPAAAPPAVAPVVPVTVLNNTRRSGFAKVAAARFAAGGWPVPMTGNYRGRISVTTIYFAPGQQASAERFAQQFHVPRVLPRSALPGNPTSGTTVVLTRGYAF